jgi:SAM-dependent methyltransferase
MTGLPPLIEDPEEVARLRAILAPLGCGGADLVLRYNQAVRWVVPWVSRVAPLHDSTIVEIGCGTGSSTAALAHIARHVYGYDIDNRLTLAATARAAAMGLTNVIVRSVEPTALIAEIEGEHRDGIDVVLLYAVLEHCTPSECLETLRATWRLLRPGGHLVVVETPNRLGYLDSHTTKLPFFHLLPDAVAVQLYRRSPRPEIVQKVDAARRHGDAAAALSLQRQGKGVSFHDFMLAFETDDLDALLVADGFEPEMLEWFPIRTEDRLLQQFFIERDVPAPPGFTRADLSLIFRKPGGPNDDGRRVDAQARKRDAFSRPRRARVHQAFGESYRVRFSSEAPIAIEAVDDDPQLTFTVAAADSDAPAAILIDISAPTETVLQVFYGSAPGHFSNETSVHTPIYEGRNLVVLEIPNGATALRLDPGTHPGRYVIHRLEVRAIAI